MSDQPNYETLLQQNEHLSRQLTVAVHALKTVHSEASAFTGDMQHVDPALVPDNLLPLKNCADTAADAIRQIAVVQFSQPVAEAG